MRGHCGPRHQGMEKKYYSVKCWQTFIRMQGIGPQKQRAILSPIPVAVQSKAQVFGRLTVGIAGTNPTNGMDVRLLCLLFVGELITRSEDSDRLCVCVLLCVI